MVAGWVSGGPATRNPQRETGVRVDMAKEEILLVDDDPTVLEALAAILRDAGYQVATARSA